MAQAIGRRKSKYLPFFHELTGCDATSSFLGHGKRSAWETWVSYPEVSDSFEQLCKSPEKPSTACLSGIEHFVILLYDGTCHCTNVNISIIYEKGSINGKAFSYSSSIAPTYSTSSVSGRPYMGTNAWFFTINTKSRRVGSGATGHWIVLSTTDHNRAGILNFTWTSKVWLSPGLQS